MIHYEDYERERLDPIYDTIAPYSEMYRSERYFLNGIIRSMKPKKILEVGVANGGGTAIILNAIKDIDGAELYSVDYLEESYRHPDKPSGFLVEEEFPQLMDKWHIFRGGDVSCFIEEIGGDIDLLVLDTMHTHPWETLNFLCILPFMKQESSWAVLHDISYFAGDKFLGGLACRYLFGHVVSEEKICPVPYIENIPANIGAFRISDITMKFADDLFGSLLLPWESKVLEQDFDSMKKIIGKYYSPEQYESFCYAYSFQKYLEKHREEIKYSFTSSLKMFAKSWQPGLYYGLKHFLKG